MTTCAPHYSLKQIANYKKNIRDQRREWLERRHRANPRCDYCRNMTVLLPRGANSQIKQEPGTFHATLDHADPVSRGGRDRSWNYRLACNTCNNLKADMSEQEYISLLIVEGIR